ncbi:MAG: DnaB-like helicase C-terminal domain-containing protein, partial [Cetobacterium sp.]
MKLTFKHMGFEVDYPEKICSDIPHHEARVLGTIVNDLSLMSELEGRDILFHTKDGTMYYELLNDMYKHRVTTYDAGAIQHSLKRLGKDFEAKFLSLNGNGYLNALRKDFSAKNFESHFDALLKSNAKLKLYKGLYMSLFNLNSGEVLDSEGLLSELENTIDEVKDASEISGTKPITLNITDEYLGEKIKGTKRGLSYGLFSVSKATRGVHLGNMSMLSSGTNVGKTSMNYSEFMMNFLDQGEKVFIYSNESAIDDFRDMLLIRTLTKHLQYYGLTRTKLNELDILKNKDRQKYEEYMIKISEARKYIDLHYGDSLVLFSVSRYSITEFNTLMRRYAHRGWKYFLLDTMKSEDAGDKQATGKLVQQSRSIYELARQLNVHVMASYQIASYLKQNMKRILDESCLSGSKQIA